MLLGEVLALLFDPPRRLFSMATAFWVSQTLFTATELQVFTILEKSPMTVEEFCRATDLQARPANALLGSLVGLGLLRFRRGRYSNARIASRWLVKGKPEYLGDGLVMLKNRLYDPWGRLTEALVHNQPTSFEPSRGELFDYLDRHPKEQTELARAHHALSLVPARELAHRFDFAKYQHLADLGGGTGIYAIEIAKRHPQLKVTVVDRMQVCQVAQEYIQAGRFDGRVATTVGDFFRDPLPSGTDVVLLSHVLHDYSPAENAGLLRHISSQLPPHGGLLLSEWLWNEDRTEPLSASLMSLTMMIDTRHGRTYTYAELHRLLRDAGFRTIERKSLYGPAQLVTAWKASS